MNHSDNQMQNDANKHHRDNHSIADEGDRTFPDLQPYESPVPQGRKEKYLDEVANIEDLPGDEDVFPHRTNEGAPSDTNTSHLTDNSGEEKNEEYINTDERQRDLNKTQNNQ
jgi:hypothetical protein